MLEKDFPNDDDQFIVNWNELIDSGVELIVPACSYNVSKDDRLLIPYMEKHHIGFVNKMAEPIVKPEYDIFKGNILKESDLMTVGKRYTYGYSRSNGEVQTYDNYKWGVIDSKGNIVIKCEYKWIFISDDNQLITLNTYKNSYFVVDRNNNVIVPPGEYGFIDGFTKGYSRIKKNDKWGIIDTKGNVALPPEYDEIWNFYNKHNLKSCKVIKKGSVERRFVFATGELEPDDFLFFDLK